LCGWLYKIVKLPLPGSLLIFLKKLRKKISPQTIRRRLQKAELKRFRPKKPWLSGKNKKSRIEWARIHKNFNDDFWTKDK
jgi:hypothetical protein